MGLVRWLVGVGPPRPPVRDLEKGLRNWAQLRPMAAVARGECRDFSENPTDFARATRPCALAPLFAWAKSGYLPLDRAPRGATKHARSDTMLVIGGAIVGAAIGAYTAKSRGGVVLDMAQYAAGYAIAFGIVGLVLTLIAGRLF